MSDLPLYAVSDPTHHSWPLMEKNVKTVQHKHATIACVCHLSPFTHRVRAFELIDAQSSPVPATATAAS
jgi:hypothetical protein